MMMHTAVENAYSGGKQSSSHPAAIQFNRNAVPIALSERPLWVVWRYEKRDGKWTKVPYDVTTENRASSTDPSTWCAFEDAVAAYESSDDCDGVGFVFSEKDSFTGVDLDDCIDENNNLVPEAEAIVRELDSYTEISPSGTGVKIFLCGTMPEGRHSTNDVQGFKKFEVYSSKRYFTVTGQRLEEISKNVELRQEQLQSLCARLLPLKQEQANNTPTFADRLSLDDEAILERACSAKNASKFTRLWNGDTSFHSGDDSAADLALCNLLAFWTGRDATQMDRIFRRSGLMRDKWDEMRGDQTYGQMTLDCAINDCSEVFSSFSQTNNKANGIIISSHDQLTDKDIGSLSSVELGKIDPNTGRTILSTRRTLPTAQAFVNRFYRHPEGRTLHHYVGHFYQWKNNRYVQVEDADISAQLMTWMHNAAQMRRIQKSGKTIAEPFPANPSTTNAALNSLRYNAHLAVSITSPMWINQRTDRPDPHEILPCKSFTLHLPTMQIIPASPALFNFNALDYDPDLNAPQPEAWLHFLSELMGDDIEAHDLLQDWFGYCITGDTSQQKMLLLVGPKRSGKGTIARVLRQLIGIGNVCGPTISGLSCNFGIQPLIGQSLAIVSDARFTGNHINTVVERLLCISGEDTLTIDQKYKESITLKLPTRFMFLTNELPRFNDASGALAGRFLILQFTKSFYGREDRQLTQKLLAELPGILNWAIAGWKRLNERGYFVQPSSVEDAMHDIENLSSPVGAFVRERCEVAPGLCVSINDIFSAWKSWCEGEGRSNISTRQTFGRNLTAFLPQIKRRRNHARGYFYEGIGLKISCSFSK